MEDTYTQDLGEVQDIDTSTTTEDVEPQEDEASLTRMQSSFSDKVASPNPNNTLGTENIVPLPTMSIDTSSCTYCKKEKPKCNCKKGYSALKNIISTPKKIDTSALAQSDDDDLLSITITPRTTKDIVTTAIIHSANVQSEEHQQVQQTPIVIQHKTPGLTKKRFKLSKDEQLIKNIVRSKISEEERSYMLQYVSLDVQEKYSDMICNTRYKDASAYIRQHFLTSISPEKMSFYDKSSSSTSEDDDDDDDEDVLEISNDLDKLVIEKPTTSKSVRIVTHPTTQTSPNVVEDKRTQEEHEQQTDIRLGSRTWIMDTISNLLDINTYKILTSIRSLEDRVTNLESNVQKITDSLSEVHDVQKNTQSMVSTELCSITAHYNQIHDSIITLRGQVKDNTTIMKQYICTTSTTPQISQEEPPTTIPITIPDVEDTVEVTKLLNTLPSDITSRLTNDELELFYTCLQDDSLLRSYISYLIQDNEKIDSIIEERNNMLDSVFQTKQNRVITAILRTYTKMKPTMLSLINKITSIKSDHAQASKLSYPCQRYERQSTIDPPRPVTTSTGLSSSRVPVHLQVNLQEQKTPTQDITTMLLSFK